MDDVARRRMLREAAAGIDALNAWVQHTLAQADEVEESDEKQASDMRACATELWGHLNGCPSILIASELHEAMAPTHSPYADPIPA